MFTDILSLYPFSMSSLLLSYFGMFFLEGLVCPQLKEYKDHLKSTPVSVIKNWSDLNRNIYKFKRTLINRQVNTRDKLFDIWKEEKTCKFMEWIHSIDLFLIDFLFFLFLVSCTVLLEAYHSLLHDVALNTLSLIWPPVAISLTNS